MQSTKQIELECQTKGNTVFVIDPSEPEGLAYGAFNDLLEAVEAVRVVKRLIKRGKLVVKP